MRANYVQAENSYFESTAGNAIGGGSLGGDDVNNSGVLKNCTIKSYNEAIIHTSGNVGLNYSWLIERCTLQITNSATTRTFSFPASGTTSFIDLYSNLSNQPMVQTLTGVTFNDIGNTVNSVIGALSPR